MRPDDQLRLRFQLVNGRVDPRTNTIVALLGEEPIWYLIWCGPQHLVEEPIATGTTPQGDARRNRIAAETRIVVEIPSGTPFTVATLLDLAAFAHLLDERAHGGVEDTDGREPTSAVTAIEVPTSLILSPVPDERFVAATKPIALKNVTEL